MAREPERSYLRLVCVITGLLVFIFAGYEVVERTWLADADMRVLHLLHILRGVGSTLLGAGLAVWFFRKEPGAFFPSEIGYVADRDGVLDHIDWFIRLRWLAICGVASAVFISQHVLGLLPEEVTAWLWLGAGALCGLNLACIYIRERVRSVRACLLWQIGTDLVILTYLLHFSGGLENPLVVLYAFHVILGGILLSRLDAYRVTAGAAVLFMLLAAFEYFGVWRHYALLTFPHEITAVEGGHAAHRLPFILAISGTFLALLMGTAYFTTAIMERLRENQRHLLKTERLSALGQLVAYIAHEINNPIGIISTQIKMIRAESDEGALPDFVKEGVEIVDRQTDRVGRVVQSLLSLSKPHAQSKVRINLDHALTEALFIAESRISRAGIVLKRKAQGVLPKTLGNYYDAVHVFLNLINNAIDAMPEGGALSLSTRTTGRWIETSILDTGEGISEENLEKIFDPLFTSKPRDRGTGLGLPISRALVKSAKGDIRVESTAGEGSVFTVRYPLSDDGDSREA